LIVDEAQRLTHKLLDEIRVLSNIELSDRKLINIFFVGQPEFIELITAPASRAIRQRIAINFHIKPLDELETGQYIEHRMEVAGATQPIFQPDAISAIHQNTGGFPRAINILCDHALVEGYVSGSTTIDGEMINRCERELNIRSGLEPSKPAAPKPAEPILPEVSASPTPRSPSKKVPLLLGIGIVAAALISYYLLWLQPRWAIQKEPQKMIEASKQPTPGLVSSNQMQPSKETETAVADPSETSAGDSDRQSSLVVANAPSPPDPQKYSQSPPKDTTAINSAPSPLMAPKSPPEWANWQKTDQQDESSVDNDTTGTDGPPGVDEAAAEAATGPSPADTQTENTVAASNEALNRIAKVTEPADSRSGSRPKLSSPNQRDRSGASADGKNTVEAGGQPAPEKTAAEPPPGPTSAHSQVEKPIADGTKAIASATAVAALSDTKPKPLPDRGTSVDRVIEKPAASVDTVTSSSTSTDKTARPSPSPRTDPTPPKPASDDPISEIKASPSEMPPPKERPEPSSAALSAATNQGQVVPSSTEESPIDLLEDRLRSFLQLYCRTYAAKDLGNFVTLFSDNAVENGKPFESLLPKYERNFKFIESIEYRIELLEFSYDEDEDMVQVEGDFFLKWLPPDKKWRENSGKISMDLQRKGATFLVQRLDYRGGGKKD
jgi:hypothetical protein